MSSPKPVICQHLCDDAPEIRHGFFTRQGGVSTGLYESLNIGHSSDDDQQYVHANRKAVVRYLGLDADDLITPWQHHSADVVIATEHWSNARPKADGIVTRTPNLPIGIVTADCGPVLFCDAQNGVVGAAHAGWRGATGGVLEATLIKMLELGAVRNNISATLGPTISGKNYEVGPEFVDNLIALNEGNEDYLRSSVNAGHAMFDLPRYIVQRLLSLGVSARWSGHCTYEDEVQFFSYRRMTHRGEADYGRQISAIAILK